MIYDEHCESAFFYNVQNYAAMARVYARLGREEDALNALKKAAESAKAFDNRPAEGKIDTLLLGEQIFQRSDHHTADDRSACRILAETYMEEHDFESVRNKAAFHAIKESLH